MRFMTYMSYSEVWYNKVLNTDSFTDINNKKAGILYILTGIYLFYVILVFITL